MEMIRRNFWMQAAKYGAPLANLQAYDGRGRARNVIISGKDIRRLVVLEPKRGAAMIIGAMNMSGGA